MTIKASGSKLHWNYFLALEQDMASLSRFVEFDPANFEVFSIELARILFAAASEVDVIAKLICKQINPKSKAQTITGYKKELLPVVAAMLATTIHVPRYGLELEPWSNWKTPGEHIHPDWWNAYNKVKHQRSSQFKQATLRHTLNALAGLLVVNHEFYLRELSPPGHPLFVKELTAQLEPTSTLFRFNDDWYYGYELRD